MSNYGHIPPQHEQARYDEQARWERERIEGQAAALGQPMCDVTLRVEPSRVVVEEPKQQESEP